MSKDKALNYLEKKAESDVEASLLQFSLLLEKAVGIGDHSTGDFLQNLDQALDNYVDATDRISAVQRIRKLHE